MTFSTQLSSTTPNESGSWVNEIIQGAVNVGVRCSIVLDTGNKIHASYTDTGSLEIKYATNISGSWIIATVDSGVDKNTISPIAVDALFTETSDLVWETFRGSSLFNA